MRTLQQMRLDLRLSLILPALLISCADDIEIAQDLDERNANRVMLLLETNSIEVTKISRPNGFAIVISEADKIAALKLLHQGGLSNSPEQSSELIIPPKPPLPRRFNDPAKTVMDQVLTASASSR